MSPIHSAFLLNLLDTLPMISEISKHCPQAPFTPYISPKLTHSSVHHHKDHIKINTVEQPDLIMPYALNIVFI
jgi:hypothetical protein